MVSTANHSAGEGISQFMKKAALALLFVLTLAPVAPQGAGDHWVGTWATAVVVRPQAPQPPPAASGPPNACAPAVFGPPPGAGRANAPAPPPPLNFKNQTLREIIHTSLAGDRVRV